MIDFKNEFSWSKSRDNLFNECKRKYYFNHYGSWGGWENNAAEITKEIYILKKLISKEIWIGQVVHDIIKNILSQFRRGKEISLTYALNLLKERLNRDFNDSKSKIYQKFPKRIALFEHEYELLISKDEWDELFKKAEKCIINFYNSDIYKKIRTTPLNDWIFLEDFLNFYFENTKVYLSIDFAIKEGNRIILYDWKTGRERDTDMNIQLTCYALFILHKWDIQPEDIIAKTYNLTIDKDDEFVINPELINKIKDYMRESICEMKDLLKDKENNIANKENFPKNQSSLCGRCNFKRICLEER